MTVVMHPRPNPIVAAMYTLRDMDVDVIVTHGPAGCCFMASRPLENAGVRVVTSALKDNDLIFGGADPLVRTAEEAIQRFHPRTMAVVGTCASTIIGDDVAAAIRRVDKGDCNLFNVDCSGCLADNTMGAIRALKAGAKAGVISKEECDRQTALLKAATALEKQKGMAGRTYLSPTKGPTKYGVAKRIANALREGKKVAFVMLAKKELAYRYADMFLAAAEACRELGGEVRCFANLDADKGLPRIRRYCTNILGELASFGVAVDIIGGLDEYAVIGEEMAEKVDEYQPDLRVFLDICHAYPDLRKDDILITDQPRELANYLAQGFEFSVGEPSSHNMVMGTDKIVMLETAETLREIARGE